MFCATIILHLQFQAPRLHGQSLSSCSNVPVQTRAFVRSQSKFNQKSRPPPSSFVPRFIIKSLIVTHHWHSIAHRAGKGQTLLVQPQPVLAGLYDKHHDIKAAHERVRPRADPGNWQVPAYVASDFASMFVYERAQIAKAANKPFILEETGKEVRLNQP